MDLTQAQHSGLAMLVLCTSMAVQAGDLSETNPAAEPASWNWHVQNTAIVQGYPAFSALYFGPKQPPARWRSP